MYVARRARAIAPERDPRGGRAFVGATAGALFGKAHVLADEVHQAMISRGYRGDARTLDRFRITALDIAVLAARGRRHAAPDRRRPCHRLNRCSSARASPTPTSTASRRSTTSRFDVAPGETLALLGANGCGKSTLLKLLDGLLFPTAGTYRAFGHPVTEDLLEDEQFSTALPQPRRLHLPEHRRAGVLAVGARGGRVRAAAARHRARRGRAADRRRDDDARDRRPRRPGAVPAVGRPEEARRDRLGARHQPRGDPVRRADRGARSAHAAVAARADRRARPGRQDDRAGDARPGRARVGLRPLPRVLRGAPDRARRHARGGARRPRHCCWPRT